VREELDTALDELRRTRAELATALRGVEELRSGMVGYLAERDQALERQRDSLLVDLLE
jgi:hypothetical protein